MAICFANLATSQDLKPRSGYFSLQNSCILSSFWEGRKPLLLSIQPVISLSDPSQQVSVVTDCVRIAPLRVITLNSFLKDSFLWIWYEEPAFSIHLNSWIWRLSLGMQQLETYIHSYFKVRPEEGGNNNIVDCGANHVTPTDLPEREIWNKTQGVGKHLLKLVLAKHGNFLILGPGKLNTESEKV